MLDEYNTKHDEKHDIKALRQCRSQIDAIDDKIIDLLQQRFTVVAEVIDIKRNYGIPVRIPARINEVLARTTAKSTGTAIPENLVARIYTEIIETTCEHEENLINKD